MIEEFKCPNCGGSVEFDWKSQNLKCPYCDTEFDPEGLKKASEEDNKEDEEGLSFTSTQKEWEEDGQRHYICHSCGGEIIAFDTEAALSCPWCGNPVVLEDQVSGVLKPDYVIPFKNGKEEAKEAFYSHLKGKKLLPPVFRDKGHIDEIKGVYVPVWMFTSTVKARMDIPATSSFVWSDNRYTYTRISHYRLIREGHMEVVNLPVDGSSKMSDSIMEPLGPWNMDEAVDFKTAYLSGFLADRYDLGPEDISGRVLERARVSCEKRLLGTTMPYVRRGGGKSSISSTSGKEDYVLLPVWLLRTKWEGKDWYYAMNGQNGKFVGDLPLDRKLLLKWFLLSFFSFGAIGAAVATLLQLL